MSKNRKNLIDGLPVSYDSNYVSKTNKKCSICQFEFKSNEIEENQILCTEDFEFMHKLCVEKNDLEIIYSNPKDFTSMIKLKKQQQQQQQQQPIISF
jgi:hypothetical protein